MFKIFLIFARCACLLSIIDFSRIDNAKRQERVIRVNDPLIARSTMRII